MKRAACLIAALSFFAVASRADDKVDDVRIEKKHTRGGATDMTKVESKARHRVGGGTVATTETTEEHQRHGKTMKKKTTRTVERDAAGNVVRQEEKVKQ